MKKYTYLLFLILLFSISTLKAQTVQIESAVKAPGDIAIAVQMLGFTGSNGSVQSIQFQIAFDDNLFYFKGASNINTNFPGWVIPSNGSSSPITISYISMAGHDIDTKILDLLFAYSGGFSGSIDFIPSGCEISRSGLMTMTNVTYVNGNVSQTAAVANVNCGSNQQVSVNDLLTVPISMQGTGLLPFSAFTYRIGYDPAKLTYVQLNNSGLGGTLVGSATGGVLTVSWNGLINSLPTAQVFDIVFTYKGGGDAPIDFLPGSLLSNPSLVIIPTTFTGIMVQNLPGSSTISMPNLGLAPNSSMSVPITLDHTTAGFIGGVNLKIGYSNSLLAFNGFTTGTLGSGITASATGGEITILWSKPSNISNVNGILLNLNFTSLATSGLSLLTFNAGSVITLTDLSNVALTYINGSLMVGTAGTNSISGFLTYLNTPATPLTNTTVLLKQGGITVDQTSTNGLGYYVFSNQPSGSYTLDAECTKPWGGVNANDALLVLKHFTTLLLLSPFKALAADVNGSNYVNTTDALMIARRYVGLITSFPVGDWLFENPTVVLPSAGYITQNFNGLCYGDVNGSNIPQTKEGSQVQIEKGENLYLSKGEIIAIPVISTSDVDLGSISLRLAYPTQAIDILDVVSPGGEGNLLYHTDDGQLNIAWFGLVPMKLKAGDMILQIKARIIQFDQGAVSFSLLPGSECGSPEAEIIDNVKFEIPSLILNEANESILEIYPNPFISNTIISYTLPESGHTSIIVCNLLGEALYTLQDKNMPEGKHQYEWMPGNIAAGIYYCKITFRGESIFKSEVKPLIHTK